MQSFDFHSPNCSQAGANFDRPRLPQLPPLDAGAGGAHSQGCKFFFFFFRPVVQDFPRFCPDMVPGVHSYSQLVYCNIPGQCIPAKTVLS